CVKAADGGNLYW
nr:immunoglobulin heavy chain junction region [Macaca mulatta]